MMRERWRLHLSKRDRSTLYLFAGWNSCTFGYTVEPESCMSTFTLHLGFVQLILEWWTR